MKKSQKNHFRTLVGFLASLLCLHSYAAPAVCTSGINCWQTIKPAEWDSRWANARCNDGTPASYQFRPSPTGSKDWVVLLEGGGACDDLTSACSTRAISHTTTSPLANRSWHEGDYHGVLSPNAAVNPEFYNANLVQIDYCSSDLWGGATTERKKTSATPNCVQGDPNCGWYFSGRYISRMAVQSLAYTTSFRDDGTHKIMFVGSSAGGFGLASAAESITSLLPNTRAADRLRFVFDGSYIPDTWGNPVPTINNGPSITMAALASKNKTFWGALYETFCERDRKLQGLDPAQCTYASIYYPYLTSARNGLGLKVFIQNSSKDTAATSRLKVTDLALWDSIMVGSLANVNWLFSTNTEYHTRMTSDKGFSAGSSDKKLWQVIGRFYRGETPQRVVY